MNCQYVVYVTEYRLVDSLNTIQFLVLCIYYITILIYFYSALSIVLKKIAMFESEPLMITEFNRIAF